MNYSAAMWKRFETSGVELPGFYKLEDQRKDAREAKAKVRNANAKAKRCYTQVTMQELDTPFTADDLQQLQSNMKEYNMIAKANNKNGFLGVLGLAQAGRISNDILHLVVRLLGSRGSNKAVMLGLIEHVL